MKTLSLQLPSLAGTLSIKSMLKSAPKHVIFILKIQKFSGKGAQSPPQTHPQREGDTPFCTHPLGACGASIFAPSALTHAPPTRKCGYKAWCIVCTSLTGLAYTTSMAYRSELTYICCSCIGETSNNSEIVKPTDERLLFSMTAMWSVASRC